MKLVSKWLPFLQTLNHMYTDFSFFPETRSPLVGLPGNIDSIEILPAFNGLRRRRFQFGFSEPRPQPVDHPQDAPVAEDATNQNAFAGKIEQHQTNEQGQQTLSWQNQHGQAAQQKYNTEGVF